MSNEYQPIPLHLPSLLAWRVRNLLGNHLTTENAIVKALNNWLDIQLSEPIAPRGTCNWCGTQTDAGITIVGIDQNIYEIVCEDCHTRGKGIMRAKAEARRLWKRPMASPPDDPIARQNDQNLRAGLEKMYGMQWNDGLDGSRD